MSKEDYIVLIKPVFKERIWGSSYFKSRRLVDNPLIGEMWSCSAVPGDECEIISNYHAKNLRELYKNYPRLFGHPKKDEFPILIKLIATKDKLSVQVHPDDAYAKEHENSLGKTEGWLILNHSNDSDIVIGHEAINRDHFLEKINNNQLESILNTVKVKDYNFYPIPSGTVHALGKDLLLLEIQQSSNITYRLFDYDRVDKNGNKRELHIQKALDVIKYEPFKEHIYNYEKYPKATIWDNEYFKIQIYDVNKEVVIDNPRYTIITAVKGRISVESHPLKVGESCLILYGKKKISIKGVGKITTTVSKEE